jgi:Flp pilus assembly protein TadG
MRILSCLAAYWKSHPKRFSRSESGAILPTIGFSLLALIGATGVAIDTARIQLVQSRLSSSLDAAGLAGGATVSTASLNSEVAKYLNANFNNYLGAKITASNVSANSDNTVFTLSATASVPLVLMNVFGAASTNVSANSQITRAGSGLELVMVLDNTGSMNNPASSSDSTSKIDALKTAASDLVNILFGNSTPSNLWVGLVPFSQAVDVGPTHTSWLDTPYYNSLNWGPTSWMGCVDARTNGYDVTDDPPSVKAFNAYYWPSDANNHWIRRNGSYRSPLDTTQGPNKQCPQQLVQMTANKNALLNSINSMQATGDTIIGEGAVWGWRMLSPRWRSLWGGEMNQNNLPLDYNTPKMHKAVVLMTDGFNTIDNSNRGAYGYLSNGVLGTTDQATAVTEMNNRLLSICTAMKNNNIYIYTIALGADVNSTSISLLQSCATQPSYYFRSPDSATLQSAFHAIGDSLSNLRVSQ